MELYRPDYTRGRTLKRTARSRSRSSSRSSSRSMSVDRGVSRKPRVGYTRPLRLTRGLRSHAFFPDKVQTNLCTIMDGRWLAGQLTSTAGNYCNIMVNSIVSPFTTPLYTFVAAPNVAFPNTAYYFNCAPIQGFNINQNPIGWQTFNGLYEYYKVVSYTVEVTMVVQAQGDSARLVVFNGGSSNIPSDAASSVNLRTMESQPFAKATTISAGVDGGPSSTNTLIYSGSVPKDLGKTYAAWMATDDVRVTSNPSNVTERDYVGIYVQEVNGSSNANSASI